MQKHLYSLIILLACTTISYGQTIRLHGSTTNLDGEIVPQVNISALTSDSTQITGTASDFDGNYNFSFTANGSIILSISCLSYEDQYININTTGVKEKELNITLKESQIVLDIINVEDKQSRYDGITRIDPEIHQNIVNPSGGIESLIKSQAGTYSRSELSSQYNVRGGNFDENLVYVNDIEIYRPVLIRSGQQEGLSFVNSSMVSSLVFSAGGFDASYGDKLSSVLDITYRVPRKNSASFTASLLGGNAFIQGVDKNNLFKYMLGTRYKTSKYLLNSLDTQGQYSPNFFDVQTYLVYSLSDVWSVSFLGNYAQNTFNFHPTIGETTFGTFNQAFKVTVYFDGQEQDKYQTGTGALTFKYKSDEDLELKFIASSFFTNETERFDILGQYYLNSLETNPGEEDYGDSINNIGVGTFLDHANNELRARVANLRHIGKKKINKHEIQWGARLQIEDIDYTLKEWNLVDSAGYSLPYNGTTVNLFNTDTSVVDIISQRAQAYVQHTYKLSLKNSEFFFKSGVRGNYWTFNNQFLVSPRASIGFDPKWDNNIIFRVSGGYYQQAPFFKELIRRDGSINHNIKAQSSTQIAVGTDYIFSIWNRYFKLTSELYYKNLWNIIPYDIDNVRIRYYGDNLAKGYVTGFDIKLNGEFVKGTESWIAFTLLKTEEDIEGDSYVNAQGETVYPGYLRRPSDQRVNVNLFFQDYLPGNKTWKAHLNLVYGSNLPFGPPNSERYLATGRIPPYRRVDLGISKQFISSKTKFAENNILRYINDFWISLEVFNLLDINNTISHVWIYDISGRQYGVPTFLTKRRLNLKLHIAF